MRVLQIANGYLKTKLYTHLFSTLEKGGIEETVFVPVDHNEKIPACPENVHIIPCFGQLDRLLFFRKQRSMLRWLEQNTDMAQFDVIHAHTVFSGGYTAYKLWQRYGIPYVVAVRSTDVNTFFKYMVHLRRLGVEIMRCAQQVVFLSPAYQKSVLSRWVPTQFRQEILEKSVVIPNGIAPLFLQQSAPAKKAPQEPLELIYVGDINSNKNPGLTITAAQHLQAMGKSVHLTAVGSIKEDKYRLLMEQTNFVTHYDRCPQEQVIQHLRKADIFVMPSHTETFGLVYAEAMSQGLPVLYTAGQGFDGHFPDGTVGYAVSDTDAEALAEKILLVAQRYEEISPACVPAAKRFNWDQIAAEYIEIYHQLAKETTQP